MLNIIKRFGFNLASGNIIYSDDTGFSKSKFQLDNNKKKQNLKITKNTYFDLRKIPPVINYSIIQTGSIKFFS